MQRALNLDASPPLSYSLRFFVTAPIYILLAAIVLIYTGPTALSSRWQPAILATTHLLALGAIAQTMIGAMLQIMPVATGIRVFQKAGRVSLIHLSLNVGTVFLAIGFLTYKPAFFLSASALLAFSFGIFLISIGWALWRDRKRRTKGAPTILMAIRLAVISLVIAVLLGVSLSTHLGANTPLDRWWTNLHASWAIFGWIGLLVIGISFQVIPIFQITERYPNLITRWLTPLLFIFLLLMSQSFSKQPPTQLWISLLFLGFSVYALVSLYLLYHRKRPKADTTTVFWRTAFCCLIIALAIWILLINNLWPSANNQLAILLGALALLGFAWTAINGMLYTILPFLLWFNAQRHAPIVIRSLPRARQYLPDKKVRPQFYVHLIALLSFLCVLFGATALFYPACIILSLSILWLYKNIIQGLRQYQLALQHIQITLSSKKAVSS